MRGYGSHRRVAGFVVLVVVGAILITGVGTAVAYQFDWLRSYVFAGPGRESGDAIAVNDAGEIYDVIKLDSPELWDAAFLEKRDAGGSLHWRRFLGLSRGKAHILPTRDGPRVAFQGQYFGSPERYAIRLAAFGEDGTPDWSVDYVPSEMMSDYPSYINGVAVDSDGRVAIALESSYPDVLDHAVAAVFDMQGNLEWEATYLPNDCEAQTGEAIAWGEDGSLFLVLGASVEIPPYRRSYLVKYRSDHVMEWSRWLGNDTFPFCHNPDLLVDGNALYTWATCRWTEGNNDFAQLIRYNADGNRVWRYAAASNPEDDESQALGLAQLPGGDVVVAEYSETYTPADQGLHFMRFNAASGNIVWTTPFDLSGIDDPYPHVSAVPGMDDQGVIWVMADFTAPPDFGHASDRLAMFRFQADGTQLSPIVFDGLSGERVDRYARAVPIPGGGMVFSAERYPWGWEFEEEYAGTQSDALLARLSAEAETVWSIGESIPRVYTTFDDTVSIPTVDGGLTVGASAISDVGSENIAIFHLDPAGSRTWQTIVASGFHDRDHLDRMIVDENGDLFILGHRIDDAGETPLVVKIDANGAFLWRQDLSIGATTPIEVSTTRMNTGPNGDLFIAGLVRHEGPVFDRKAWLARLDADGNLRWLTPDISMTTDDDYLEDLTVDAQGYSYVLTLNFFSDVNRNVAILRRVDPDGHSLWEILYGRSASYNTTAKRLMIGSDDKVRILGTRFTSLPPLTNWPTIAKFGNDGTLLDEHVFDMSGGINMSNYALSSDIQVVRQPDGTMFWFGRYDSTKPWQEPFKHGAYVMKSTPDYEMEWIYTTPHGFRYYFFGQAVNDQKSSHVVDENGRVFIPVTMYLLASAVPSTGDRYIEMTLALSPSGAVYSANIFQPIPAYSTELFNSVPGQESFYGVGISTFDRYWTSDVLTVARYDNPCGVTTCPWLGGCVDVGDQQPGNPCWTCEDVNGLAQFVGEPEGSACGDDGLYCNGEEVCRDGWCVHDGNPCEPLMCVESSERCLPGPPNPFEFEGFDDKVAVSGEGLGDPLFTPWIAYAKSSAELDEPADAPVPVGDEEPAAGCGF